MGILRLPGRNGYWRVRKRLFKTNFSKVMLRDRFNLIWRYFLLQDNESQLVGWDNLHKIRWFLDYLNRKFAEAYTPYGNYTVDVHDQIQELSEFLAVYASQAHQVGRKSGDASRERDWLHIPFSGLHRKGNHLETSKRSRPPRGDRSGQTAT